MTSRYGFVGLGAMGAPMVANLVAAGHEVVVFDKAGTVARAPAGTRPAATLADVVQTAHCVFLSLPDAAASAAVADDICAVVDRAVAHVIDLSTVGITAARTISATYAGAAITYIDAPVSGGQAGARAGTLSIIWGGPGDVLEHHRPALNALSKNVFHVGDEPGQGQAMKLLNNFLSATAMAATSEAMAFGLDHGLDMATMLDVLNASTGQNQATADKFPKRIVTGTYDAGFRTELMAKDLSLYISSACASGAPRAIGQHVHDIWQATARALPDSDFTRIFD
ncbi:MAG: NAD(P)-dependent oxidoreductase, partial [Alphaproteobacteria bacterium]